MFEMEQYLVQGQFEKYGDMQSVVAIQAPGKLVAAELFARIVQHKTGNIPYSCVVQQAGLNSATRYHFSTRVAVNIVGLMDETHPPPAVIHDFSDVDDVWETEQPIDKSNETKLINSKVKNVHDSNVIEVDFSRPKTD